MPVKVQADLPVKEILESENIFVMDETRAVHQDIRPLKIMILNLMPLKEDTELQLLRSLSNTSLQVDVTFLMVASHEAKNTSTSHLNTFYVKFEDVRKNYYDGMIITGALDEHTRYLHDVPLLGSPGESVSFLWTEETDASGEEIRAVLAQSQQPQDPACARLR